jgi:hypothetical protein
MLAAMALFTRVNLVTIGLFTVLTIHHSV